MTKSEQLAAVERACNALAALKGSELHDRIHGLDPDVFAALDGALGELGYRVWPLQAFASREKADSGPRESADEKTG